VALLPVSHGREISMLYVIGSAALALVLGYVAGFVMFRRSLRWCPICGAGTSCVECASRRAAYGQIVNPTTFAVAERRRARA
jgi:hypothetical protein